MTIALASDPGSTTLGGTVTITVGRRGRLFRADVDIAASDLAFKITSTGLTSAISNPLTVNPRSRSVSARHEPSPTAVAGLAFVTEPILDVDSTEISRPLIAAPP